MKSVKRFLPIMLLVAAGLLIVGLTLAARRGGGGDLFAGSRRATSSDQAMAQLLQSQQEILRRLDRLESARLDGRGATPAAGRSDSRAAGNGGLSMSAAEIAASQAALMRQRENAFVNEPLSAAWASSSEKKIGKVLSAASLAKEGATAPTSVESTCHSQTCRISMSFDDGVQASFTKVVFLEQIGETLPQAEIFEQAMPDGSTRFVVYARRNDASPARQ